MLFSLNLNPNLQFILENFDLNWGMKNSYINNEIAKLAVDQQEIAYKVLEKMKDQSRFLDQLQSSNWFFRHYSIYKERQPRPPYADIYSGKRSPAIKSKTSRHILLVMNDYGI